MKTALTTCILLLTVNLIFAVQPKSNNDFRCRSNYETINSSLPLSKQLELDLIAGFWVTLNEDNFLENQLIFNASGKATHLDQSIAKHYTEKDLSWSLQEEGNMLNLLLTDNNGDIKKYEIAPNCEGIAISHEGETKVFTYTPALNAQALEEIKEALYGEWENILSKVELEALGNPEIPNVSLEGVRVHIDFQRNGQFTKSIITQEGTSFKENGKWDLSPDGQYIHLFCTDSEGSRVVQAVKIKHLEMDEMVLEQPLAMIGKSYSTNKKYFFFNKI